MVIRTLSEIAINVGIVDTSSVEHIMKDPLYRVLIRCSYDLNLLYSIRPKVFEQIETVPQVAHDEDTYSTSNMT